MSQAGKVRVVLRTYEEVEGAFGVGKCLFGVR